MKKPFPSLKLYFIAFLVGGLGFLATANTGVKDLICEYHTNPIGLDVKNPRLSWKIFSEKENVIQTAYEIRVADSPANLAKSSRLIWTSGKMAGSESVNVEYQGPQLKSMQRVYWQVRIWDNNDKATKWSEPAFGEMGILEPELWTASWITMENEVSKEDSKPSHFLRKEFSTPKKVKSARVYVSAL